MVLPDLLEIEPAYSEVFKAIGLTNAHEFWRHPSIQIWRAITDRENGVIDTHWPDGRKLRLHVKRDRYGKSASAPCGREAYGIQMLRNAGLPTAELAAWALLDPETAVVTEHLDGYSPADKLIERDLPFSQILASTAHLTAQLHEAKLFHRDLYLCHFFVKASAQSADLKFIDLARVLYNPWLKRRWMIKDLAQFWYSTLALPITDAERDEWLMHYSQTRKIKRVNALKASVIAKADSIARHDAKLREKQPKRNISINT